MEKNQNKKVKLRKGLYYDSDQDYYYFDTDKPEELGPISVGLQVTRRCNANCIHCAASDSSPEVDTKGMLKIIDRLHEGGCVRVCVTGGEPLIRDDLEQLLKRMHDYGMAVTLSTNGFELDKDKLKRFKKYVSNIRFSLHGLEKNNDYIFQRKGAFKRIMERIDMSKELGLSVGVIFSALKQNVSDLVDLAKILEEKGVSKMIIFTLMDVGRARALYEEQLVIAPIMNKYLIDFNKLKKTNGLKIKINLVDWRLEGQCLMIDPLGNMFGYDPTSKDNIFEVGNVLESTVDDLWKKYPFKKNYINYYQNH